MKISVTRDKIQLTLVNVNILNDLKSSYENSNFRLKVLMKFSSASVTAQLTEGIQIAPALLQP